MENWMFNEIGLWWTFWWRRLPAWV